MDINTYMNTTETMLTWYNESLDRFGDSDFRSLTWGDESGTSARRRYQLIHDIKSLNDNSVLEVGCGWGSIFDFGYNPNTYLGMDINEKFIDIANKKYVNNFITADIMTYDINTHYDVAIASGVAGNRGGPAWNPKLLVSFMDRMFNNANTVIINFPSIWSDIRSEHVEYFSPEYVLSTGLQITRNIQLIHFDRFDFFIILNK